MRSEAKTLCSLDISPHKHGELCSPPFCPLTLPGRRPEARSTPRSSPVPAPGRRRRPSPAPNRMRCGSRRRVLECACWAWYIYAGAHPTHSNRLSAPPHTIHAGRFRSQRRARASKALLRQANYGPRHHRRRVPGLYLDCHGARCDGRFGSGQGCASEHDCIAHGTCIVFPLSLAPQLLQ